MAAPPAFTFVCIIFLMISSQMQGALSAAVHADSRYCSSCHRTISCPSTCPKINDTKSPTLCSITCGKKCSAVCKTNAGCSTGCLKKGAVCSDPRFVGGDGAFFYFHGKANEDFCIVSDNNVHINGHFIGKRVAGRTRDFTWVQAIGLLYGPHQVSVSAKKVATWDDTVDHVELAYDGAPITLATQFGEQWVSPLGEFNVVRTEDLNSIEIEVTNLLKISINVTYVNEQDSKIHGYKINGHDCFTHLDLHFTFFNLSSQVDGVLGQTYNPNYLNPMKVDVPMPIMGGYEKFKSSSLFSTDCKVACFDCSSFSKMDPLVTLALKPMSCTSQGKNGIVCHR